MGLASFLYNIPRFFEVTWENEIDEYSEENITVVAPTLLRRDPIYIRYTYVTHCNRLLLRMVKIGEYKGSVCSGFLSKISK